MAADENKNGEWAHPDDGTPPGTAGPAPGVLPPYEPAGVPTAPPEPTGAALAPRLGPSGQSGAGPVGRPATSEVAVAALVCGICALPPVAVVLGIVALVRIGRGGQRGTGLAIGGLVGGFVWTMIFLLWLGGGTISFSVGTTPNGGGAAGGVTMAELSSGQCLGDVDPDVIRKTGRLPVVDCTEPHVAQVAAVYHEPPGDYPGEREIARRGLVECAGRVGLAILKHPQAEALNLKSSVLWPREELWQAGVRQVVCLAGSTSQFLTEPLDFTGSIPPNRKAWMELDRGDCVKETLSTLKSLVMTTVSCREPHFGQAFHKITLPPGPWQGQDRLHEAVRPQCEERTRDLRPPPEMRRGIRFGVLGPDEQAWESGHRTVVCVAFSEEGRLPGRSLLPTRS